MCYTESAGKMRLFLNKLALTGGHMYKFERYRQLGLADFNQPVGLKMNPENRWVKKEATIPWNAIEENMNNFSQAGSAWHVWKSCHLMPTTNPMF